MKSREHTQKLSHVLSFAWQMGFFVVIPLALLSFAGSWYDGYVGDHRHVFLFFGIFIGIILSVSEIARILSPHIRGKKHD